MTSPFRTASTVAAPSQPMSQRHHRRQGRDAGVDHGADQPNGHLEHGDFMGLNLVI